MKDIPGYEGKYAATEDGRIYSHKSKRFLKPYRCTRGYEQQSLDGKKQFIHRLVALTYLPNPQNKDFVNHKNGNKSDNRVSNLEWCTRSENMQHARDVLGIKFNFKLNPHPPKLTYEQAHEIRSLKGKVSSNVLCKRYKVSRSCILFIWTNRTYKEAV